MNDFNIPDFLRLIGRGPDERPEWWCDSLYFTDVDVSSECDFRDILTAWTPEKDALLLGTDLEYCRSVAGPRVSKVSSSEGLGAVRIYNKLSEIGESWYSLCFHCDQPGLTLARAIWDAMKGGEE
jgi:hypothetical protein